MCVRACMHACVSIYISLRELGRRVRDAVKKAKYSLAVAINRLAQSYSMLILAIGLDDQHHSMRGRYAHTHLIYIQTRMKWF